MARTLTFLTLILVLITNLMWAGDTGVATPPSTADLGIESPSLTDDNTDTYLYTFNLTTAIGGGTDYPLGVAYAGGYFWISSAGASYEDPADNMIYKLSSLGVLLESFPQPNVGSGRGFVDLTWDGTYLYGCCREIPYLVAFDMEGRLVPSHYVPKPPYTIYDEGIAYNPTLDRFWLGSDTHVWEFDRQGNTIWQGDVGPVYYQKGLAFDYGVGGPFLWMFDCDGGPATTLRKFNPLTHTLIPGTYAIGQFTGCGGQMAGGLEVTHEYNPNYWALVGLALGSPYDWCFVWQIRTYQDPQSPAAPIGFNVGNNGPELLATLTWTNPTLNAGGGTLTTISGIIIKREGVVIDTIPGHAGEVMSYTDLVPNPADWHYQVSIYNQYGASTSVSDGAWIGLDVPSYVTNLVGAGVDTLLVAHLTWDNPTTGYHNGYFSQDSITGYTIERYNQVGQLQATFTPTGLLTSYDDNTVPEGGYYKYGVKVGTSTGWSYSVQTDLFPVGPTAFVEYPFYWIELRDVGINTGITARDQNVGPFDLGFNYSMYGNTFNSIRICSNGFASFTSTSATHDNVPIPTTEEPNNLVAPLWRFLNPGIFNGAVWYLADTANQRFIVEWDSMAALGYKEWLPMTFEAIIYESGDIDFMYQIFIEDWPNDYTIGIENGPGTQGVQCSYNASGPFFPANNAGVRIFNQYSPPPEIVLSLTPTVQPVVIPANGGSFSYNLTVTNSGSSGLFTDLWIEVMYPDSSLVSPLLGPVSLNVPVGTRSWLRTQNVPASAPSGDYTYIGKAGDYPGLPWSLSSFPFTKLSTGNGTRVGDWGSWGDDFGEMTNTFGNQITKPGLNGISPNPFNPTTMLSYELQAASFVNLSVYDISGKMVAVLVNGMRDGGSHQVTFDGSNLPSGIYFARLTAGEYSSVQKMVLLK
ncbi:MAG: T9SS type A sorting domain-containing protein [bacterium]|nr:T9SS type A sorting domain-containing protein [bacterium]